LPIKRYTVSTKKESRHQTQGGGVLPVPIRGASGGDENIRAGDYSLNAMKMCVSEFQRRNLNMGDV
jgi:hypothetical protein